MSGQPGTNLHVVRETVGGAVHQFEPWKTIEQLAQHLGVSERVIFERMKDGMPHTHLGPNRRLLRFKFSRVDAWLDGRGVAA